MQETPTFVILCNLGLLSWNATLWITLYTIMHQSPPTVITRIMRCAIMGLWLVGGAYEAQLVSEVVSRVWALNGADAFLLVFILGVITPAILVTQIVRYRYPSYWVRILSQVREKSETTNPSDSVGERRHIRRSALFKVLRLYVILALCVYTFKEVYSGDGILSVLRFTRIVLFVGLPCICVLLVMWRFSDRRSNRL